MLNTSHPPDGQQPRISEKLDERLPKIWPALTPPSGHFDDLQMHTFMFIQLWTERSSFNKIFILTLFLLQITLLDLFFVYLLKYMLAALSLLAKRLRRWATALEDFVLYPPIEQKENRRKKNIKLSGSGKKK